MPTALAASEAPFLTVAHALKLSPAVSSAAATAVTVATAWGTLGALLALIAGIPRTSLAMAGNGDLPSRRMAVSGRGVPWLSDLTTAVVVIGLGVLGRAVHRAIMTRTS